MKIFVSSTGRALPKQAGSKSSTSPARASYAYAALLFNDRFSYAFKCIMLGFLAMAVVLSLPLAHAATYTWDSGGSHATSPTDGAGTWSTGNANWSNGSSDVNWTSASAGTDTALFGNGGAGGTVTVSGSVGVGGIIFNPVSSTYTISSGTITLNSATITTNASSAKIGSVLAGTTGLTITGTGTLNLIGANTYSGNTTINDGTLNLGGGGSTGSINSGSALVLGGGALNLTTTGGVTQTFNGTTINGGGASSISNSVSTDTLALGALSETTGTGASVNFTNTGSITTTTANNTTGILGAWATFGNSGADGATATWAANNGSGVIVPYTGYTQISNSGATSPTLNASTVTQNWQTGGTPANGYVTTIASSGTINTLTMGGDVTISSGATLTLGGGGLVLDGISRWLKNNGNGNTTGTGQITTGLSSGELFLDVPSNTSDANNWNIWTYIVNNGSTPTILVKNGPGLVTINAASNYSGGTVLNQGTISLGTGSSGSPVTSGPLGTGTLTMNGGTLQMNAMTLGNNVVVPSGASAIINNQTNNATLNGNFSGGGTLTLQNSSGNNLSENVNGSWSGFTGTLIYNASAGSILNIFPPASFNLSNAAMVFSNTGNNSGSSFRPSGTTQLGSLAGPAGYIQLSGTLQIGNLNTSTTFGGAIQNAGTIMKVGTGTLTLTGANTFTGLVLNGGELDLGSSGAIGSVTAITFGGGTLQYSTSNTTDYSARIAAGTSTGAVSIDTNGQPVTFATALTASQSGGLTKIGSGTLTLSAGNTYSGGTIVNAGTLVLGYANSGTGTIRGTLTINAGALVNATAGDALGYNSGASVTTMYINGGTFNNTTSSNNGFITNFVLTGGTLASSGGGVYNFSNGSYGFTTNASPNLSLISGNLLGRTGGNNPIGFNVAQGTTSNGIDLQVSGVISDTGGGISKSGAGNLVLTNTNAYTGATTVSGGTLTLSGTAAINNSSGITINGSGAKFVQTSTTAVSPTVTLTQGTVAGIGTINTVNVANLLANTVQNGNSAIGTLTIGNLTFSGAGSLTIKDSGVATTPGIDVTGTLTTVNNQTGEITVNASQATWSNGTTYDLASFGTLVGGSNDFQEGNISGLTSRQSATLGLSGSFITLAVAGDFPVWTGSSGTNWTTDTIGGSGNWRLNTQQTETDFIAGDTVLFSDSAVGTTVNIYDANVAPTSTTFNNNTLTYTVTSGSGFGISAGFVIKSGSGTVVMNTSNSYSGGTTINAGLYQLGNANALGATTGALAVNSGTLDLYGNSVTVGALSGSNGAIITNNSSSANATFTAGGSGNTTYGGQLLDGTNGETLAFTMAGSGMLTLTGSNAYSGATTINSGGTLQLGNGGITGVLSTSSTITDNGNLTFNRSNAVTQGTDFSSAGIAGTGSLTQAGSNTLTLNAVNSYTGATTINAGGALVIASAGQLGSGSYAGSIVDNGTFNYNSSAAQTLSGAISGAGTLVQNGPGLLTLTGASPSFTGSAAISSGTLQIGNGTTDGSVANVSGISVANGAVLDFNVASSQSASAAISGSGALIKIGGGTLTLSGNSSYSGGTTLNAGTLTVGSNSALGSGTLTLNGGTLKAGGGYTLANNIAILGAAVLNMAGNNTTMNGNLSGTAGFTLNNSSFASTLNLGGSNGGYSGTFTVSSGNAMSFNSTNAGSASAAWVFNDNAGDRVRINIGNGTINFGSIAGSGQIQNDTGSTAATLSVGALNTSTTFNGTLNNGVGTLALLKTGTGSLTLTSANGYSGGTTLNAGTLQLGNSTAIGSGKLTINGGSLDSSVTNLTETNNNAQVWNSNFTFVGTQNLNLGTGAVTLGASPTVTVSADTLTVGGSIGDSGSGYGITVAGSGTLLIEGSSSYTGATTINSGATLQLGNGASGHDGTIENTSSLTDNGTLVFNRFGAVSSALAISGSGNVIKTGAGSQTLTANSGYTGTTTVQNGALIVSGSLSGTTTVNVSGGSNLEVDGALNNAATVAVTGATLQGTGTVGPVNVTGGTVAPGLTAASTAAGTLAANGAVSLDSASTFSIRLGVSNVSGTDNDVLSSSGAVSLNGTLNLVLGSTFANAPIGTFYNIILGGAAPTGYFSNAVPTAGIGQIAVGPYQFEVIYGSDGTTDGEANIGNDVTLLETVPEPGTWAMMLGGLGMLITVQRMRRRNL